MLPCLLLWRNGGAASGLGSRDEIQVDESVVQPRIARMGADDFQVW
jgi:hypothetical protein